MGNQNGFNRPGFVGRKNFIAAASHEKRIVDNKVIPCSNVRRSPHKRQGSSSYDTGTSYCLPSDSSTNAIQCISQSGYSTCIPKTVTAYKRPAKKKKHDYVYISSASTMRPRIKLWITSSSSKTRILSILG